MSTKIPDVPYRVNRPGGENGHAHPPHDPADPIFAPQQAEATAVVRLILGRKVLEKTRKALPGDWLTLAGFVEESTGLEPEALWKRVKNQYLANLKARYPDVAKLLLDALKVAWAKAGEDDPGDEAEPEPEPEPTGPPPFTLGLIDSATFFSQEYPVDWLIKGMTVSGEPSGVSGPSKALKTSILIDKVISLASATRFLGKFEVPLPRRVALISGESGKRVIQSSARQVCLSRGLTPGDLANVHWGFTLPQLTNTEHLNVLRKTIEDRGLEYIGIDPFYLAVMAGSSGVDPKNMFEMGPILHDVASVCLESGCTPDIAHHFTKNRNDPYAPPELGEIAYAGFGQFIRQWMLIAPREKFDAEIGLFKLHFAYGGSAGHCGDFAVDIEVGKLDPDMDRRCWKVTIASPSEERAAQQERRKAEHDRKSAEKEQEKADKQAKAEREDMGTVMDLMRKEPDRQSTAGNLRSKAGWNDTRTKRTLYLLAEAGLVRHAKLKVKIGSGAERSCDGYEIPEPEGAGS